MEILKVDTISDVTVHPGVYEVDGKLMGIEVESGKIVKLANLFVPPPVKAMPVKAAASMNGASDKPKRKYVRKVKVTAPAATDVTAHVSASPAV